MCFPFLGCTTAESLLPIRIRIGVIVQHRLPFPCLVHLRILLFPCCAVSIQIFFFQIGKKHYLCWNALAKNTISNPFQYFFSSKYDVSINLWPWELLWHLEFHRRGMCELQINGSGRCLHLFFLTTQIGRADATVGFPLRPPPFRYLWSTCHRCTPSIIGVVLAVLGCAGCDFAAWDIWFFFEWCILLSNPNDV